MSRAPCSAPSMPHDGIADGDDEGPRGGPAPGGGGAGHPDPTALEMGVAVTDWMSGTP